MAPTDDEEITADLTGIHEPFPLDYDELVELFGEEG